MAAEKPTHICWLCGKDADLRACKIDERGKPVHETCYMARVALEAGRLTSSSPSSEVP